LLELHERGVSVALDNFGAISPLDPVRDRDDPQRVSEVDDRPGDRSIGRARRHPGDERVIELDDVDR